MVKSLPPQIAALQSSIKAITVDLDNLHASLKRTDGRHDETDARVAALEGRDGRLEDMAAHVASLKDKVDQHSTLIDANFASSNDISARLAALEGKTGQHDDKLKSHDEAISDLSACDAETGNAIDDLIDHVNACSRVSEANDSELSRCLVSMNGNTQMLFDHTYIVGHHVGYINYNDLVSVVYKPQPRFTRSEHVKSARDDDMAAKAGHPLVAGLGELESMYDRKPCSEEPTANEVEHAGSTCDDHIAANIKQSDTVIERLGRLESIVKAHELSCSEEHAAQNNSLAKVVNDLDCKLQSFGSHIGCACVDFEDLRKRLSVLETIVSAEGERLLIDNECLQARIGALATKLEHNSADSMKCIYEHFDDASYRIGITEEKCMSHLEGLAAKLSHRIDTLQKDGLTQTAHLLTSLLGSVEAAGKVNNNEGSERNKSAASLTVIESPGLPARERIHANMGMIDHTVEGLVKVHDLAKALVNKITAIIVPEPTFVHVADAPDAVNHRVGTIGYDDNSASELENEESKTLCEASDANDELLSTEPAQPEVEVVESQQDSSSGVTAATVETIPETVHVGSAVKSEPLRILNPHSLNADGTAKNGEAVTVIDAVATLLCSSGNPEKHKFEDLVNLDVRVARYAATFSYSTWGTAFEDRSHRLKFDFLREGQTIQVCTANIGV